jgi:hypothetical protein
MEVKLLSQSGDTLYTRYTMNRRPAAGLNAARRSKRF